MNCTFLCRCLVLCALFMLPLGCNDAGNDEMTEEEQDEMDDQHGSEEYQQYNSSGEGGPGGATREEGTQDDPDVEVEGE